MTCDTPEEEYSIILETLCRWQKADRVLELISSWLDDAFKVKPAEDEPSEKTQKSEQTTKKVELQSHSDFVAYKYILYPKQT